MKKKIIQGPNTSLQSQILGHSLLDIPTLKEKEEIFKYFDEKHEANEIFINAHAGTITKEKALSHISTNKNTYNRDELLKGFDHPYSDSLEYLPSHLFLELYREESQVCSMLVNSILSKIINNTKDTKPNIVHIFSCFSGTGHHYLKGVDGNIVLCTYASPENFEQGMIEKVLFQHYNKAEHLIDFIVKKLPVLIGSGFAVSYKSNNIIHSLKFDMKDIESANNPADITKFIQAQYKKIADFQHFDQNHSKIFPEYNLPEVKEYYNEDLKLFWDQMLACGHINKLTIPQIQDLLKIEGLRVAPALLKTIEQKNTEILELLLNYKDTKLMCLHYTAAINSGNLEIIEMVVNKMDKLDSSDLETAMKTNNSQIIDIVRKKSDESNDTKSNSESQINNSVTHEKTSEIKSILDKNTDINILDFNAVINSNEINNSEKLTFVKKISNPTYIYFMLAQSCSKLNDIDKLDILKVMLNNMTESCKLQLIKACSNQEIIKMVESHMPNVNSEPTETIEHSNLAEDVHEVPTVGEVYDNI